MTLVPIGSDIEKQLERDWERRYERSSTAPSSGHGRYRDDGDFSSLPDQHHMSDHRDEGRHRSNSSSSGNRYRDRSESPEASEGRPRHVSTESSEFYKTQTPNNTILVRGLPQHVAENDLRKEIMQTGLMPKDIRLIRKRDTGESRGFAFMEFNTITEAKQWMDIKQGVLVLYDSQKALMQYSFPKQSQGLERGLPKGTQDWFCMKCGAHNFKRRDTCFKCLTPRIESELGGEGFDEISPHPTYTLLLRNLDVLTTEDSVLQAIQVISSTLPIRSIRIDRDSLTNTSRGVCYVELNSVQDSMQLYNGLISNVPLVIDGKTVHVSYCKLQQRSSSTSVSQKPMKYTKQDINQLAEYSAKMYATTEAELTYYTDYYRKYYENEMKEGRLNQHETSSANTAAAVAQSAIQQMQAIKDIKSVEPPRPSDPYSYQATASNEINTSIEPDANRYHYDETSGYYYDPSTGLYYDPNTQYFYNSQTQQYVYWDAEKKSYLPVANNETDESNNKEDGKTKKKDKVKVAKKIAKDMERWAKTLNQKKENSRNAVSANSEPSQSRGAADAGYAVLERRELGEPSSSYSATDDSSNLPVKGTPGTLVAAYGNDSDSENETDEDRFTDWNKLACLLCKRQFGNKDTLVRHQQLSDLHKENLKKAGISESSTKEYRDRAKERRKKFGQPEVPNKLKEKYLEVKEATTSYEEPTRAGIGSDNIGNRLLQKMGWSEGMGLGKSNQGRTQIIEATMRAPSVGLGVKTYGVVPGENTYKESVKKMALMRYQELTEQEKQGNNN